MTSLKSMDNKELATKSSATVEVDDLLFEIFLRLPIQSIQRFITTCKQWQSLMTLPRFRKLWRKRNLKLATGIFVRYFTSEPFLTYLVPFSPNKPTIQCLTCFASYVTILQSCNGLLLCCTGDILVYYVYNPTTNTYHTLPQVDFDVPDGTSIMRLNRTSIVSLAFDPNKSPHYKVIYIRNKPCVHVYSSDTRCWKLVSESNTRRDLRRRGVYWNGAINWFGWYFDIENEKFKTLPIPMDLWNGTLSYYFGESCERLIFVKLCKSELDSSSSAYVYELKRDYSEWVSKYHVKLDDNYSILSVVYGLEDDDSFLVLTKRDRIVRYNLLSKTYEELNSPPTGGYAKLSVFQHIESLCGV